jgi:hypothetical protein
MASLLISLFLASAASGASSFPDSAVLALIKSYGAGEPGMATCLHIDDKDPPGPLLKRLLEKTPFVVPGSVCKTSHNKVVHVPSGKPAAKLWLSDFRLVGKSQATASVASYFGPQSGGQWSVNMRLVKGNWVIESSTNSIIF